jgi:hypothetical protein
MDKKEIEDSIRKYLRDNLTQHPWAFPDTLTEVIKLSKILAGSYWEHRDSLEIRRDNAAGVTIEDYERWCVDELLELKKTALYN